VRTIFCSSWELYIQGIGIGLATVHSEKDSRVLMTGGLNNIINATAEL
jgi:hypothetical protein